MNINNTTSSKKEGDEPIKNGIKLEQHLQSKLQINAMGTSLSSIQNEKEGAGTWTQPFRARAYTDSTCTARGYTQGNPRRQPPLHSGHCRDDQTWKPLENEDANEDRRRGLGRGSISSDKRPKTIPKATGQI